ncbi:riboflavin kinase [Daldinia caldariorum]|uniref:riboflavin kinase n=1 Tax=Daldinia caldariorum TaxID=326644 RepID=UPI002008196E|nr:riboflavin kinase [Daldinia caldariorum]KAI1472896.1 riboflavin kinase [Daldinia caldariorum]
MATAGAAEDRPRILYSDSGPEPPYPLRMEGTVISGFGRGSKELGIPTANLPVDSVTTPWIATAKSGVYFGYAALALPSSHPDRQDATTINSDSDSNNTNSTGANQSHEPRHRSNPRAAVDAPPTSHPPPPRTTITSVSTASETFPSLSTSKPTSTSTSSPTPHDSASAPTSSSPKQQQQQQHWQIYPMVMSIGYNPFYKNAVRSAEVHVLRSFGADFYGAPVRLLILGFVREERDYASLDALVADINIDCEVARASLARPAWTPRQQQGSAGELDASWLVRDE